MNHRKKNRGFTLIELIVVMAVMVIITGAMLAKYRNYGSDALFANATEDIVLALRQAQLYGVGVKGNAAACGSGSTFDCSYGVNFDLSTPNMLTIFVDNNDNSLYDVGASPSELVQTVSWKSPIVIQSMTCDGAPCSGNVMNVTFKRPDVAGIINDNVKHIAPAIISNGVITISNGVQSSVITITYTGQISLQ